MSDFPRLSRRDWLELSAAGVVASPREIATPADRP
jgi:hypothetical protein